MKSFVVQNFIHQYPLTEKTYRHLYTSILKHYKLIILQLFKFLIIKDKNY
jgi:hypothetical protein